jgi:hypothetical protein
MAHEVDAGRSFGILRQVADALDTAHEAGLIHRDVKPQNVLVAGRDHAYLADFGLTKSVDETGLTRTGQFMGTVDYIAPEQIRAEEVTSQSDVYSLGAVLFECLTGVVPYPRDSDVAVLYCHMTDPPPKVTDQRPDLPRALDEVMARAMAKDPGERFPTAGAMVEAAQQAYEPRDHAGVTVPSPIEVSEETVLAPPAGQDEPTALAGTPTVRAGLAPTVDAGVAPAQAAKRESTVTERWHVGGPPVRVVAILAALVGVVVVGVLLGHSGSGKGSSAGSNVASAGSLRISFPKEWSSSASPENIPGFTFSDPIAVAPAHPVDGEALVAGRVSAGGRLLLPSGFVSALRDKPAGGDAVKLGDLQAYRYSRLTPSGLQKWVTVYTVPTSAGVATVACLFGTRTPSSFAAQCERAAGSLELTSGKHYPVGPSEDYASTLSTTILRLNASVEPGQATLRGATTAGSQATAAAALGSAFGKAATQLEKLDLSPSDAGANRTLIAALRSTSSHYSAAAAAARRGDRSAYNQASAAIRQDDRSTRRALAVLEQLGYPVG